MVQIACQNYWRDQPHHTGFPALFNSSQSLSFPSSFHPIRGSSEYLDCATNADVQAAAAKLQTSMRSQAYILTLALTCEVGFSSRDYHYGPLVRPFHRMVGAVWRLSRSNESFSCCPVRCPFHVRSFPFLLYNLSPNEYIFRPAIPCTLSHQIPRTV